MRNLFKLIALLILTLLIFALYTFSTTGFFRKIENFNTDKIHQKIVLPGVEDIQASYTDSFLILSSDDRASRRDGETLQGHLYYIDLKDNSFTPKQLTPNLKIPFFPHGFSMIKIENRKYKIYVINHVDEEHSIEVFNLIGDSLVHQETIKDERMISPNDIVAIDGNRFYFTNDHGYTRGIKKMAEEYGGLAVSNVVYFNGEEFKTVAKKIAYANGINYDKARNLLFVASPRGFKVNVYQPQPNGDLEAYDVINCKTGVDNIEFDENGNLLIGCHPDLLTFASYALGKKAKSPSEVISINYKGKGDYEISPLFIDDGSNMSASTVAVPFEDYLFLGNVMDKHFLVLKGVE